MSAVERSVEFNVKNALGRPKPTLDAFFSVKAPSPPVGPSRQQAEGSTDSGGRPPLCRPLQRPSQRPYSGPKPSATPSVRRSRLRNPPQRASRSEARPGQSFASTPRRLGNLKSGGSGWRGRGGEAGVATSGCAQVISFFFSSVHTDFR